MFITGINFVILTMFIGTQQTKSKSSSNVYVLQTDITVSDEDQNVIGEGSLNVHIISQLKICLYFKTLLNPFLKCLKTTSPWGVHINSKGLQTINCLIRL